MMLLKERQLVATLCGNPFTTTALSVQATMLPATETRTLVYLHVTDTWE